MTEEKKLLNFVQMDFSQATLAKVPEPFLEFALASSIASNDLTVFNRVNIFTASDVSDVTLVTLIAKAHNLTLERSLLSKIVEFIYIYEQFSNKIKRSKKLTHTIDLKIIENLIDPLKNTTEYIIASNIRDNSTHHYIGNKLIKLIDKFNPDHTFTGFLHKNNGNSFYIYAEEIAYFGNIRKYGNGKVGHEELRAWMWDASAKLVQFQQTFLRDIFKTFLADTIYENKAVEVEKRFVANFDEEMPLFADESFKTPNEG